MKDMLYFDAEFVYIINYRKELVKFYNQINWSSNKWKMKKLAKDGCWFSSSFSHDEK